MAGDKAAAGGIIDLVGQDVARRIKRQKPQTIGVKIRRGLEIGNQVCGGVKPDGTATWQGQGLGRSQIDQGRFGQAATELAGTGRAAHVLAIAGGSGITPILSILRTLLATAPRVRCTLLYGNRHAASTMFKEELEDLKNRYLTRLALHPVFSREQVDSPLGAGRLDAQRIGLFLRTLIDPQGVDHAFVCGPHALNDEAEAAL
jgi:hypothetical protein